MKASECQPLRWLQHGDGWIGTLPCGLVIYITKVVASKDNEPTFAVRFANCSLPETFKTEVDAKTGGVVLARRVLTTCLIALQTHHL